MHNFWLKALIIFIISTLLLPFESVSAQSTLPPGPVYIVQEGDYLWDIAYRFHVSQADLENANGIVDPNQITIGQQLVIPGLEDIQGILTTEDISYGETLHSLSLRYHLSMDMLKRLNHLTSPNELYAGYSLVILQNNDPPSMGKRITLSTGQSLLELAILNDTDPWTILAKNQADNSTSLLPDDIIRAPGENDTGPGALSPVISSVNISGLIQGKTAELQINGTEGISITGSLMDHTLNFFTSVDGNYYTLQGVHAMAQPGLYSLNLNGNNSTDDSFNFSQMVLIASGNYSSELINNVDPLTLDPKITVPEDQLWLQLSSPVNPEKYWAGLFSSPVDPAYINCYTSWYGTRRSYNGSAFDYVHTGQDFCGQIGNPIYAAASGIVVFAGPLTVRGNATMIDHGHGVFSAYMHQSEILVNIGDKVEQGQLIGRVGNTGRVEGPHLHFEVLVGGVQVDPLEWLNQAFP
ncbi:MAG: peptidoglycan DD-metalloendopeptidase family protein [Anaerolineales bacterium]